MFYCRKIGTFRLKDLMRNKRSSPLRPHTLNKDCYLYDFEDTEDYPYFLKEARRSKITLYKFNGKSGIAQTKICPWCHATKTKVDDWAVHCAKYHAKLNSSDALERAFAGYKVQMYLYKKLTGFLHKSWKQLAFLEGGCHQCTNTGLMFDDTENTVPHRCVRMDTPKYRVRDFWHIQVDIDKFKREHHLVDDVLVGGIVRFSKKGI